MSRFRAIVMRPRVRVGLGVIGLLIGVIAAVCYVDSWWRPVRLLVPGPSLGDSIALELLGEGLEFDNYTFEVAEPSTLKNILNRILGRYTYVVISYSIKKEVLFAMDRSGDGESCYGSFPLPYEDYRVLVTHDSQAPMRQPEATEEARALELAEWRLARRGLSGEYVREGVSRSGGFWVIRYEYADETKRIASSGVKTCPDMTVLVPESSGKVQIYDAAGREEYWNVPAE